MKLPFFSFWYQFVNIAFIKRITFSIEISLNAIDFPDTIVSRIIVELRNFLVLGDIRNLKKWKK